MIENIYYSLHRLATPKHDRNSTVAPGYWQFKVRQAALKACRNIQGNILDIGCGDGLFLAQLVQQNLSARIWAIDISAETIQYARQRLMNQNISSVNFLQQDATALDFGEMRFDAVVCTNLFMVMDSLETVRRVLLSVGGVCRKGASIFFDYRNAANPFLKLKYKLAPIYDKTVKGHYINTYYTSDIVEALEQANMCMVSQQCIGLPCKWNLLVPVFFVTALKNDSKITDHRFNDFCQGYSICINTSVVS